MLQEIHSAEELESLYTQEEALFLMKHSSACGTSHYAFTEVKAFADGNPDMTVAYVVIQEHRDLSNAIADRLSIIHKSPQIFLLQSGQVIWSTSHMGITRSDMGKAVQDISV